MRLVSAILVVVGFFLAAAFWPAPVPDTATERFTATRISTSDKQSSTIEFVIERRSTEGERQQLLDSMHQPGPENLLKAIQTLPRVGYMLDAEGAAYDLHYVHGVKGEDGAERVTLATDQPARFDDGSEQPPETDNPFTLIELRVNDNGQGNGKLSLVTKLGKRGPLPLTLEEYNVRPLYLLRVTREVTR